MKIIFLQIPDNLLCHELIKCNLWIWKCYKFRLENHLIECYSKTINTHGHSRYKMKKGFDSLVLQSCGRLEDYSSFLFRLKINQWAALMPLKKMKPIITAFTKLTTIIILELRFSYITICMLFCITTPKPSSI